MKYPKEIAVDSDAATYVSVDKTKAAGGDMVNVTINALPSDKVVALYKSDNTIYDVMTESGSITMPYSAITIKAESDVLLYDGTVAAAGAGIQPIRTTDSMAKYGYVPAPWGKPSAVMAQNVGCSIFNRLDALNDDDYFVFWLRFGWVDDTTQNFELKADFDGDSTYETTLGSTTAEGGKPASLIVTVAQLKAMLGDNTYDKMSLQGYLTTTGKGANMGLISVEYHKALTIAIDDSAKDFVKVSKATGLFPTENVTIEFANLPSGTIIQAYVGEDSVKTWNKNETASWNMVYGNVILKAEQLNLWSNKVLAMGTAAKNNKHDYSAVEATSLIPSFGVFFNGTWVGPNHVFAEIAADDLLMNLEYYNDNDKIVTWVASGYDANIDSYSISYQLYNATTTSEYVLIKTFARDEQGDGTGFETASKYAEIAVTVAELKQVAQQNVYTNIRFRLETKKSESASDSGFMNLFCYSIEFHAAVITKDALLYDGSWNGNTGKPVPEGSLCTGVNGAKDWTASKIVTVDISGIVANLDNLADDDYIAVYAQMYQWDDTITKSVSIVIGDTTIDLIKDTTNQDLLIWKITVKQLKEIAGIEDVKSCMVKLVATGELDCYLYSVAFHKA